MIRVLHLVRHKKGGPNISDNSCAGGYNVNLDKTLKKNCVACSQVLLTAWKLSVHIDTNRVEEMLGMLAEELCGT